jgi:predicted Zn-dependent peptidase
VVGAVEPLQVVQELEKRLQQKEKKKPLLKKKKLFLKKSRLFLVEKLKNLPEEQVSSAHRNHLKSRSENSSRV